jgi:septal ring factor EnvC (AmiA/AmiB activator)
VLGSNLGQGTRHSDRLLSRYYSVPPRNSTTLRLRPLSSKSFPFISRLTIRRKPDKKLAEAGGKISSTRKKLAEAGGKISSTRKKLAEAGGKISSTCKETSRSRRQDQLNSQETSRSRWQDQLNLQRNQQKQVARSAQLAKKPAEAEGKISLACRLLQSDFLLSLLFDCEVGGDAALQIIRL